MFSLWSEQHYRTLRGNHVCIDVGLAGGEVLHPVKKHCSAQHGEMSRDKVSTDHVSFDSEIGEALKHL